MQGLNQDLPLLLSSVLQHGATTYGAVEVIGGHANEAIDYDYVRLEVRARQLASALFGLGYGPDRFIGSLAWNTHRHLELFYAVTGVGAVLHTANPRLPPAQIAYTINFTGYETLFIDTDTLALAEQLAPQLHTVQRYVMMAPPGAWPPTSLPLLSYEDLLASGNAGFTWPVLDERSACLLCFTSGTTGMPKGALYTHRGTVLNALSTGGGNAWALNADDAILAIPGFFHCNGWGVPFFGPMYGAKLVLPGRRADSAFLHALIVEHGVTVAPGVPTIFLDLLRHCRETGGGLGRLNRIFSGGAAPPLAMMEAYLRDYGVRTIHGWGMTETTSGATMSFAPRDLPPDEALRAMRTQGRPVFGAAIRISGDDGTELPRDGITPGHLEVRSHWAAAGYFQRLEVEATTADGWLRTGDVAKIDPDNTLHLVDRSKDVIKSGGEWISSQALEDAATNHPAVREAAVIAMPHPRWQERPLLIVVAARPVTQAALQAHLLTLVPKWWLPDAIAFVDALPHGPTGKLDKQELRRWLADGRLDIASAPS
ncbi:AMP-binding protein [Acidisphaera sp. S103]|uniref:AMP-binding protein n=1 Tax=Acidisphaera sp. S103 TaxID=1747223 RepID=UPI00131CF55C|nr:AMP-binding protein [Acidisphaera sp. S103]